ncbi:MAG: GNAT family N-acetyltransferase [Rothia sp. (in: high G+C Gram-positive bacteria)]|nr:GNAT family N-acetyltransferase [Rothia sp. (in: high G+C Gram-positive bacteria)]
MALHYEWLTPQLELEVPTWCSQKELTFDQTRNIDTRSLAVFAETNEPVALVEWFTPKAHHTHYYLNIEVAPHLRRRGIGTEVFRLASLLRHQDIPFTCRGYLHSEELAFAYSLGATTKQIVPPDKANMTHKDELRPLPSIRSLKTEEAATFQQAYLSMYEWMHEQWSPVSGVHQQTIQRDALADLDYEATSVHYDSSGAIDAFIAVYQMDGSPILLGETTSRSAQDGERIIEACLRRSLDVLSERGVLEVGMDGHISDPHWFPNWIKLSPYGEWFQLLEIPASDQPSIISPRR